MNVAFTVPVSPSSTATSFTPRPGAPSSSVIVPVAVGSSGRLALLASLRVTVNVSSASATEVSPVTGHVEGLRGVAGGEGQRPARPSRARCSPSPAVAVSPSPLCAAQSTVTASTRPAQGHRERRVHRAAVALPHRHVVHATRPGVLVVVGDRPGRRRVVREGRVARVAQGHGERLVRLVHGVAGHRHVEGRRGFAGGEGQRSACPRCSPRPPSRSRPRSPSPPSPPVRSPRPASP